MPLTLEDIDFIIRFKSILLAMKHYKEEMQMLAILGPIWRQVSHYHKCIPTLIVQIEGEKMCKQRFSTLNGAIHGAIALLMFFPYVYR